MLNNTGQSKESFSFVPITAISTSYYSINNHDVHQYGRQEICDVEDTPTARGLLEHEKYKMADNIPDSVNTCVVVVIEPQLVSKPNTTSSVWRYFGLAVGEEGKYKDSDRPVCRICFSEISAKWRNTSNLYTHLQKKHPDKVKVKPTSSKANDTTACCSKSEQQTMEQCQARTLTKAVTRFLAKDMVPLYQVDKSGFREMIQAINPRYQLPHKD